MSPLAMLAEKDFAGRQSVGKRGGQEDTYAFSEIPARPGAASGVLLVVADGMGGHSAGQWGSEIAVRHFMGAFHRGGETMRERFSRALETANQAIAAAVTAEPGLNGMGTTLLAVALTPLGIEWISVGDSPLYLWRRGKIRRLNADHSFRAILEEKVALGEMTPDEAGQSNLRTRLRSAVTGYDIPLVDLATRPLPLLEGDIVVAASDGLNTLADEELASVIGDHAAEDAADIAVTLVRAVLQKDLPKQDNVTVAIVKPPAEWLFAPFGFAQIEPAAAVPSDEMASTTVRLVPRRLNQVPEDRETPAS